MDRVTLTQKTQDEFEIVPLTLMMNAVGDDDSCQQTLQADAYEFLIKLYIKSVKANIQTNTFNFFFIFFNLESVGNEWQRVCVRKVA